MNVFLCATVSQPEGGWSTILLVAQNADCGVGIQLLSRDLAHGRFLWGGTMYRMMSSRTN